MSVGNMQNRLKNTHQRESNASLSLSIQNDNRGTSPPPSPSSPLPRPGSANGSPDGRNSNWHKTSFKIGKPKSSKTRYLTKNEIIGVALSAIVSLIFSLIILALVYYGTPIVARKFLSLINFGASSDISDDGMPDLSSLSNSKQLMKHTVGVPHKVIKTYHKLSLKSFQDIYLTNVPVLFTLDELGTNQKVDGQLSTMECFASVYDQLQLLSEEDIIHLFPMNHFINAPFSDSSHYNNITLPVKTFLSTQVSLDIERNSYLAVDTSLAKRINVTLSSLLPKDHILVDNFNGEPKLVISRSDDNLSGSPFHAHKQFLHYLSSGRKHWVLFKQNSLPRSGFNPQRNLRHWLKHNNNNSSHTDNNNVFHVFQEAGEVLYVPEGWYHASDTLSDISIGISFTTLSTQPTSYYHYMSEGIQRIKSNDIQGGIRWFKLGLGINRNIQLLAHYADALILSKSYTAAEEVLREILQENPQDPSIYSKLINMMIDHANKDISESIAELLDQSDKFGIRDDVLSLSQQNL